MRRLNIPFRSGSKSDHSSVSRDTSSTRSPLPGVPELPNPAPGSPEAKIIENISAFCEPRYRSDPNEPESSYLPGVIEPAEASPQAAAWAARKILQYFPEPDDLGQEDASGKKDKRRKGKFNGAEAPVLYNAINLLGLLSSHPGKTFTQNLNNEHAVGRVRAILVHERDPSVQQILREELNKVEGAARVDENLQSLAQMWNEEKRRPNRPQHAYARPVPTMNYGAPMPPQSSRHNSRSTVLPPPDELAGRTHEATETAKLLIQITQAASPETIESDDMIQDVAERSRKASRNLQGYLDCTNPPPDPETMQTLINTYQAVSVALIRYWTAVMNARKSLQQSRPPLNGQEPTRVDWAAQRPSPPPPQSNGPMAQDNPFSDTNQSVAQPPPQQVQRKPHPLFGRSDAQPQQYSPPPQAVSMPNSEAQGARYNSSFRSTPSYVARQDSAIGNVTMHGASPPPDESDTSTR